MLKLNELNKIIIVMDAFKVRILNAQGVKIVSEIDNLIPNYPKLKHQRQPKHQGYCGKSKTQSHFFDPHREAKDIERQEYTKFVIRALEIFLQKHPQYNELIIVAEPKVLGEFRKHLSKELHKMVSKEISKDLLGSNNIEIAIAVFG